MVSVFAAVFWPLPSIGSSISRWPAADLRDFFGAAALPPAAGKAPAAEKPAASKKGKKRAEGQREMLLPIEGKKQKEAAKKVAAKPAGKQRKAG